MRYNMMLQYMYIFHNDQIRVVSLSITEHLSFLYGEKDFMVNKIFLLGGRGYM